MAAKDVGISSRQGSRRRAL